MSYMNFLKGIGVVFIILLAFPSNVLSQGPDCSQALVICTDGDVGFNPDGPGDNDFANSGNDNGCLLANENQSAWYYFEFQPDMPPNSIIEFTIAPNAGAGEDYDFAIYGPDVECDALGSPIRCSFAAGGCSFCPSTGLGNGTTDTSEDSGGDGYVEALVVQPGEGYFLVVDNFNSSSQGFVMSWGESAAPFLNCNATPGCALEIVTNGPFQICPGAGVIGLTAVVTGNIGPVSYDWVASDGGAYLDDPTSPNPTVTLPDGFSGDLSFILTVVDSDCSESATVDISTFPPLDLEDAEYEFCFGEEITISVPGNYQNFMWSSGHTTSSIVVDASGVFTVTVTDDNGCSGEATYTIVEFPELLPVIAGDNSVCIGSSATFGLTTDFFAYDWSTGEITPDITVYDPGTYTVTVTNEAGCFEVATWVVDAITFPELVVDGSNGLCPGSETLISTESGFAEYYWNNLDQGAVINVSEPGFYEVTVVDDDGCLHFGDIDIEALEAPLPFIQGNDSFCTNDSTELTLGDAYQSYAWSTTETSPSIFASETGNYSVTVTAGNGCVGEAYFDVAEQAASVSITGQDEFCQGDAVVISVTNNYNSYQWSNGGTTSSISVTEGGVYDILVADQYGCSARDTFTVIENILPEFDIEGNLAICPNGQTVLMPDSMYTSYLWSNSDMAHSITVNTPGSYTLTVTDSNGCSSDQTVTVEEEAMLDISLNGVLGICDNSATEIGVDGNYATYLWSTGETTPTVTVGTAGLVEVTVADAFGCIGEASVGITVFNLPDVTIEGASEFCEGTSTILGTNMNFATYEWSDGSTNPLDTILTPGIVTVLVTDGNGCQNSAQLEIVENPNPIPEIEGDLQFCPSTSAVLNAPETYDTYLWSTGSVDQETTVSAVGTVSVTVVDSNGCEGSASVDVSNYQVEFPAIEGPLQFCPEGETILNVTPVFSSYEWSFGGAANPVTVDEIGSVSVTVTDGNGCETSANTNLSYFNVATPDISGDTAFCAGGIAILNGEAGFASYEWSSGSDANSTEVTAGGEYFLTVTDNNGCESQNSFEVTENPLPEFEIGGLAQFCVGFSTELSVEDTYTEFNWSDGTTGSSTVVSTPGLYSVSVTDEYGCVGESDLMVEELQSLSPEIFGNLQYCENESTDLQGTVGFTTYNWSTGADEGAITVSSPGVYSLTVSDESGCTGEAMVSVSENPLPQPQIIGDFDFCPDENAQLGANIAYSAYLWSSGDTLASISTNEAGDYQLTVTDANGCQNEANAIVTANPVPDFSILGIDYFCEGTNTSLTVSGDFSDYSWSNGSQSQTTMVSTEGVISVQVENEFGCKSEASIEIDEIALPDFTAGDDLNLDCELRSVNLGGNYSIPDNWDFVWSGDGLSDEQLNEANPMVETPGVFSLYLSDETHGCQTESSNVEVFDLAYTPGIILDVSDTLDCLLQSVRISANGSEEGAEIRYQWYKEHEILPGETHPFIFVNEPGLYAFEVMDDLTHCQAIDDVEVIEDHAFPVADAGSPQHLDCNITQVNLEGINSQAGPNITYEWSALGSGFIISGDETNAAIVNSPGFYEIVVSDTLNGCSNADTVEVTQNILPPIVGAGGDQTLDCQVLEVELTGSVSVDSGTVILNWTQLGNPASIGHSLELTTTTPGVYQLEAINGNNGCRDTDQVEVILDDNSPQEIILDHQDNSCYQTDDAYIVISDIVGGTPPLLYSINGGNFSSQNIYTDLSAGSYSIQVEDANGCELERTVFINEGNDLAVELGDDIFIDFGESVNIEAQISLAFDSLASFVWQVQDSIDCLDPTCVAFQSTPLQTTDYHVTISDKNGCVKEDALTVFVNKPRDVFIPNGFSPNGDGINDALVVFGGKNVAYVESFLIFNRWGEVVFEVYDFPPNDPTYGWDGDYRGERYNSAVFTYFAEVVFIDGEKVLYKGDVTLVK